MLSSGDGVSEPAAEEGHAPAGTLYPRIPHAGSVVSVDQEVKCPACGAAMTSLTLDGRMRTNVQIDLCTSCQVIWFDHLESVRLSPGATLEVFRIIGKDPQRSLSPIPDRVACPRCQLRLLLTHDRQRNTPFRYWRCARDHGRLTTFFDFLREKDFIRPLSTEQITELRANIQHVNCSGCGAPIDLAHASACSHCRAPLSMLDVRQIERMANQLRDADEKSKTTDSKLSELSDLFEPQTKAEEMEGLFELLRSEVDWISSTGGGLVEAGLRLLGRRLL